jgi:hypothetical protein
MEIFGLNITKKVAEKEKTKRISPIPKSDDVGGITVSTTATGGYFGQYVDMEGTTSDSEHDLILKYRESARQPECDSAVSDIVDAAIASADKSAPVELQMDELDMPDSIKKEVKEVKKTTDPKTKIEFEEIVNEYYIYSEKFNTKHATNHKIGGIKIAKDAIIFANSGITDPTRKRIVSHLHKAIKLVNQLRMMEDSLVVYRVSRAPERRIFYIDVGNLPKNKAEEYIQNVVSKYRNKLVYDASTGEITDDRRHMSMLEDFYLPRREGGRGTEIDTLAGGENLGQIDDVVFFQKKLYRALNVPVGRLEEDATYAFGRATEVSRDEVKFQRFIDRLRKKFSSIFLDALRTQLILKGIIKKSEWSEIGEKINIDFIEDNYFSELKEHEIMKERLEMASSFQDLVGKYYSVKWLRANILRQSDEDIDRMNKEIEDEIKSGVLAAPDDDI